MTADEIKSVVTEVLSEQAATRQDYMDDAMLKTMATLLTSFGIEDEDRLELKADFSYLRRFRKSAEQIQSYTWKAIVTVVVGAFLGAVWLGIKVSLGK